MNITLLYVDECPNWKVADARLAAIAADQPDLTVTHHPVGSAEEAERRGFHGSPSILVDGVDVLADAGTSIGLSCRLYQTPDGPAGSPTLEQLRAAIARSRPHAADARQGIDDAGC